MRRSVSLLIGIVAVAAPLVAGCARPAGGSSQAANVITPMPTQTPWIIEQTVVVTRLVEVVATPTEVLPTSVPTATPAADLAGARDLAFVPRPPGAAITGYATTRKHLFLDYSYSADGPSASDIAEFFIAEMDGLGWELTRHETEDDRVSLTFEPGLGAPDPMPGVDYVRILVRGDIGEVSIIVNTLKEMSDWEAFFGS